MRVACISALFLCGCLDFAEKYDACVDAGRCSDSNAGGGPTNGGGAAAGGGSAIGGGGSATGGGTTGGGSATGGGTTGGGSATGGGGVDAGVLAFVPPSFDFMTISITTDGGALLQGSLFNSGAASVSQPVLAVSGAAFSLENNLCTSDLAAGGHCNFGVRFVPTSGGQASGEVTVDTDGGLHAEAPLTGIGSVPGPSMTLVGVDAGFPLTQVSVAASPLTFSVVNTGSVNLTNISIAPAAEFAVVATGCAGVTVTPTQPCQFTVTFTPTSGGLQMANIAVSAESAGGPAAASVNVSGVGGWPLSITAVGGAGLGHVVDDAGIDCSASCSSLHGPGSVTLDAEPRKYGRFDFWDGGVCSGTVPSCTFTMSGPTSVSADFDRYNIMFLTSLAYTGALMTVSGADTRCATLAADAGLPDAGWTAWLSNYGVNAASRLGTARGWVLVDGTPFVDTVADLTQGRIRAIPNLFETGVHMPPDPNEVFEFAHDNFYVWTATWPDGVNDDDAGTSSCNAWTATTEPFVLVGEPDWGGGRWTAQYTAACSQPERLYCFGTDRTTVLPPTPVPLGGRLAFLSTRQVDGSASNAVADQICNDDAADAGHAQDFVALRASVGTTAASRVRTDAGTWYRADGAKLLASASDLPTSISFLQPLTLKGDGTAVEDSAEMWNGGTSPSDIGTDAGTCASWTLDAGTGYYGFPLAGTKDFWGSIVPLSCGSRHYVACFER